MATWNVTSTLNKGTANSEAQARDENVFLVEVYNLLKINILPKKLSNKPVTKHLRVFIMNILCLLSITHHRNSS